MNPLVSIVVPIYNMETYLDRCLGSLLGQSLTDIEIIAVNDGSQDQSLTILQNYSEQDSRIKIVNKENGGLSAARNDGILAASGQYIGFVDPDDWVDLSMYEEMYHAAVDEDADIVMCTYVREFETHSKEKVFPHPEKLIYRSEQVQANMLRRIVGPLKDELANPEYLDAWGTVWNKIYRASLLREHDLKFTDHKIIGSIEDTLFNIPTFYYAKSFVLLNQPFYHYWRANASSITSKYNPFLTERFGNLYNIIQSFITEKKLSDDFKIALNNRICMNVLGLGLNILNLRHTATIREKMKLMNKLLNNERIMESLKHLEIQYCPLVWKAFFLCAKMKHSLAMLIMLTAINWLRESSSRRTKVGTSSNLTGSHSDESRRFRNHDHELLQTNGSKQNSI